MFALIQDFELFIIPLDSPLGLSVLSQVCHLDRSLASAANNGTLGDRRRAPVSAGLTALVDQGLNAGPVIDVATSRILHGFPHLLPADGADDVDLHLDFDSC